MTEAHVYGRDWVRDDFGDQIYVSRVANFVFVLAQPAGDSSTSFSFGPAQARELAAALLEAARRIEEDVS